MDSYLGEFHQVRHFCNTIEIIKGKSRVISIVLLFNMFNWLVRK